MVDRARFFGETSTITSPITHKPLLSKILAKFSFLKYAVCEFKINNNNNSYYFKMFTRLETPNTLQKRSALD